MNEDRVGSITEAQIGALQAYAAFMEELVAAMLVARVCDVNVVAVRSAYDGSEESVAQIAKADAQAAERNGEVRALFERGAGLRLTCAKIGALPLPPPTVSLPDVPPRPAGAA